MLMKHFSGTKPHIILGTDSRFIIRYLSQLSDYLAGAETSFHHHVHTSFGTDLVFFQWLPTLYNFKV
jgi:hypothetical protein